MVNQTEALTLLFTTHQPPTFWADAEVIGVEQISPRFRRVRLGGDELAPFIQGFTPGDAIKLLLTDGPSPEPIELETPGLRDRVYTLTNVNAAVGTVDIEILSHGEAPGTAWSQAAKPGWRVRIGGPRFGYRPDPQTQSFFLYADLSALPAAIEIAKSLAGRSVDLTVEVPDESEIRTLDCDITVRWPVASKTPGEVLLEHIRSIEWRPEMAVQIWMAGESGAMKEVRRFLRVTCGMPQERVTVTGYWTNGHAGTDVKRLAEAARLARESGFDGNQYGLDSYEPEVDGKRSEQGA